MIQFCKADLGLTRSLGYRLTTPPDFDPAQERLPMIVFLHGAGERGESLDKLRVHAIPKQFADGVCPRFPDLRVLTLSPQCPEGLCWNDMVLFVVELIDRVAREQNVDPDRVSVTGLSMGGFGTYSLATSFPDRFSAVGICCGGGMGWRAGQLAGIPVRLYHGKCDTVVPYENSLLLARALEEVGNTPALTLYDNTGHNCWDRAFDESDLIPWLVAQRRGKKSV